MKFYLIKVNKKEKYKLKLLLRFKKISEGIYRESISRRRDTLLIQLKKFKDFGDIIFRIKETKRNKARDLLIQQENKYQIL